MKIKNEYVSYYKECKEFEIELDNGEMLNVCKTIEDGVDITDMDYGFDSESKKKFDALPEEEQERVVEFISEFEM